MEILRLSDDRLTRDWRSTALQVLIFALAHQGRAYLGFDDLGGVFLRIYNGNDHDRISLLNHSPGGRRSFLAAE